MPSRAMRFFRDASGTFAVAAAVMAVPLLLSVGLAADYSRYVSARAHLQELADSTALALAASGEENDKTLRKLANKFITSNRSLGRVDSVKIDDLISTKSRIDLALGGQLETYFMKLAGISIVDVGASALAERAVTGSVEVALVLDNTWSMSEKGLTGVSRITTLKDAAGSLVTELFSNDGVNVRIGIVPYADYVNVGTQHRDASWLSVPDDYTIEPKPRVCETKKVTTTPCEERAPRYACTRYIDGIAEASTCGGGCTKKGKSKTEEMKVCSGGGSPRVYSWHGCVGSRRKSDNRLHDNNPSEQYPGYVESRQNCLNPIVPLTTDEDVVLSAIDGMIINIGSYKPYTYIPAGLIWGQNVLSPDEPFTEGANYDPFNAKPRKVAVLMTDGENTLRFRANNGRHVALNGKSSKAKGEIKKTNSDTAAICDYMKAKEIEIFTVAFMVDDPDAKSLLEGCATDASHYYDASDPEKLLAAFSGIAESLTQVRLAR